MATYTITSKNHTDTAVPGVTTLSLNRDVVNYGADFARKVDEPGEGVVTNLTSPLDAPEQFRFAVSNIADVYRGTGIDSSFYGKSKKGKSLLIQLTDTWTESCTEDPSWDVRLPVSAHIVLKIPDRPSITTADIIGLLGRTVSGLFATGSDGTTRLESMLRGSMLPTDI